MFTLDQQAASAVPFENIFHFAYIVPDLKEAMASLSETLKTEWATPFQRDSEIERPDGSVDRSRVRVTYSLAGPPFMELIQHVSGPPDSIFAAPPGAHHVGIYAERWRDETARLVGLGFVHECGGNGLAFVRHPLLGLRVEVISFKGRDLLTRILSGEVGASAPVTDDA